MNLWPFLLAVVAGTGIAVQAASNSALRGAVKVPMLATLFSFTIGLVTAALFCLAAGYPWPKWGEVRETSWWYWIAGPLGVFYIFCSIVLVPRIGVAAFFACMVGGQLFAALFMDSFGLMGVAVQPLQPGRVVGLALVFAGILVITFTRN